MKFLKLFFLFMTLFFSCQTEKLNSRPDYVGDIQFDEKLDKKDFFLCDGGDIYQYFNNSGGMEYEGEKLAIEEEFSKKYHSENVKNENGWVRIRFVVNCKGETDRFRILVSDFNYQPIEMDSKITTQLLQITKDLKGWKTKTYQKHTVDYYQYLIFKIKDGKIAEILP